MIKLCDVSFQYEGELEYCLDHVNFQAEKGECILITGPSGCGKTTLLRLVNGLIPHFYPGKLTGEIGVNGICPGEVPLYAQAGFVSTVFQNPKSQFYTTDPASEIAFSLENRGIAPDEILERVGKTVDALDLAPLMDRSLFHLSGGEKQRIACACVTAADTDVILMDEPTANLDEETSLQLKRIIAEWKAEGKTILIAEHRIAWILDLASRIVVMDKGRIREELEPEQYGLRSPFQENPLDIEIPVLHAQNEASLEIRDLCFSYKPGQMILDYERIPIAEGKITALIGRNGKGKTTFLRCLSGLEKKDKSSLLFHGTQLNRRQRRKKVYLIAQDVNFQLFTQEVREEVRISLPREVQKDETLAEKRIHEIAERLDLVNLLDRDPVTLSGGQKQRVAVAGAIASEREILLFDEPTSGLDFRHMKEMAELLKQCAADGRTIIVATHDSELIRACADYRIVL